MALLPRKPGLKTKITRTLGHLEACVNAQGCTSQKGSEREPPYYSASQDMGREERRERVSWSSVLEGRHKKLVALGASTENNELGSFLVV